MSRLNELLTQLELSPDELVAELEKLLENKVDLAKKPGKSPETTEPKKRGRPKKIEIHENNKSISPEVKSNKSKSKSKLRSKSPSKPPSKSPSKVTPDVEVNPPNYVCTSCSTTFFLAKSRKQCPSCNKRTLVRIEQKSQVESTDSFVFRREKKELPQTRINPKTGKEERACKRREVRTFKNEFKDDGKLFKDDTKKFTKKVKFSVSPRTAESKLVSVICESCKNSFDVAPILAAGETFKCNNCIIKRK